MSAPSRAVVPGVLLVLAGLVFGVVGVVGVVGASTSHDEARSAAGDGVAHAVSSPSPTSSTAPSSDAGQALVVPEGDQPAPVRVRIPAIGVDSPLDALVTDRSGALRAPPHWQRAGWFADGVRPGDPGPAVVAGHVDSPSGPAVFARLAEIGRGEVIAIVQRGGSVVRFRVDRTQVVGKRTFPTAAVYGPTPDSQLRLITCDGPYVESAGGYQDNLIVFASKVT